MRKITVVALSLLVLATFSCTSMKSDSGLGQATGDFARPTVEVIQISEVASAARHMQGGLPINYRVVVSNPGEKAVTLKSLNVQSVGRGAYEVQPTTRAFKVTVEPSASGTADFWLPAEAFGSISGANGPVTLRVIAHFDSPLGQFDEVVVQQVSGMSTVR